MNAALALLIDLGPLLFGLVVGTLANFGLEIDRGEPIPPRKVYAHLMILGLLGLIASVGSELVHASAQMRALAGAGAALLGAKLARRFLGWSEREAERRLPLPPMSKEDRP